MQKSKRKKVYIDYMRVIGRGNLSMSEKIMILYLMHPGYKDTRTVIHADELRMSDRTVSALWRALEKKGYVTVERRLRAIGSQDFNCYSLTDKAWDLVAGR